MARNPVIELVCDRTGETEIIRTGVSLEDLDGATALSDAPALDLVFRPRGADPVKVVFQDLGSPSEQFIKQLVVAIQSDKFFHLVENEPAAADESRSNASAPERADEVKTSQPSEPAPAKPKGRGRRTMAEVEADRLAGLVETASERVAELEQSPEADDMDIADAREELRKALRLQLHFEQLDENGRMDRGRLERQARKDGVPVPLPKGELPKLTEEILVRYGFKEEAPVDDEVEPKEEAPGDSEPIDDGEAFETPSDNEPHDNNTGGGEDDPEAFL